MDEKFMDEKLERFFAETGSQPPFITERIIEAELSERSRRLSFTLLSVAAFLWSALNYCVAVLIWRQNETRGIVVLAGMTVAYICAGLFAALVLKFRKVVYRHD